MRIQIQKNADAYEVMAKVSNLLKSLDAEKEYTIEIKEDKQKRSLNANNYFWVLCNKLAEKLNIASTDIYRDLIKNIGGNNDILCLKKEAVDKFCKLWMSRGIGWVTEVSDSKLDGCKIVTAYYGSSTYDTSQMSRLIELVVQECKQQDIETWTPEQLARLCEEWKSNQ